PSSSTVLRQPGGSGPVAMARTYDSQEQEAHRLLARPIHSQPQPTGPHLARCMRRARRGHEREPSRWGELAGLWLLRPAARPLWLWLADNYGGTRSRRNARLRAGEVVWGRLRDLGGR